MPHAHGSVRVAAGIERHLGAPALITHGRDVEGGRDAPLRVGTYPDQPVENAFILATLDLADTLIRAPKAKRCTRSC